MDFNLATFMQVIPRGLISLITLLFITKLLGKRQVSELSLFDYVIGISIGNFAAEITINTDVHLANGVFAVILFGLVAYIVSKLTLKSVWMRRIVNGVPSILFDNGMFITKNMKKNHFDINDLLEEARLNGYFNIDEIECAILETNGKVSFLPKSQNKPVTQKDMKIKSTKSCLYANVIIDGKYMIDNLKEIKKDKEWLESKLKAKGYKSIKNIVLATVDNQDKIIIYEQKNCSKVSSVLE